MKFEGNVVGLEVARRDVKNARVDGDVCERGRRARDMLSNRQD